MRRVITIALLFVGLSGVTQTVWKSDKAHSKLTFSITHLAVSDVLGMFDDFDVVINTTKPDFSDAKFDLTVKTSSINTEVERRDQDLKSPNFFDVEKFPTMTFATTSLTSIGNNKYKLTGNLTLKDVTKPVTFELWYRGTTENPMSKVSVAGFQLTGMIKRSDFNFAPKSSPPMLSDEISIKADGEFSPAK